MVENRGLGERHRDTIADVEPLDNPVWHALTGPQAEFSEGSSLALRYQPDVAVFAALPDEAGADAWNALATLVGPGGAAVAVPTRRGRRSRATGNVPIRMDSLQMVATERDRRARSTPSTELGAADVAGDARARRAHAARTVLANGHVELGTYLGIRSEPDGRLSR